MTISNKDESTTATDHVERLLGALEKSHNRWLELLAMYWFPLELLDGETHDCPVCGAERSFFAYPEVNESGHMECIECMEKSTGSLTGTKGLCTLFWYWDCSLEKAISAVELLPKQLPRDR